MIDGIYNYCDRWCERCPFTSRCANFALVEQYFPDPQDRDIRNQHFWDKLHEVFQTTLDMLRKDAEARCPSSHVGGDTDGVDDVDRVDEPPPHLGGLSSRELAKSHECANLAREYSRLTEQWFDSTEALFEEKRRELELIARLDLPNRNPQEEAASLQDAVEVIRWYQDQVYIKLLRAISGKLGEMPAASEEGGQNGQGGIGGAPKDSDGSAKVALLGMDRSIAAWGAMRGHFPERADDILDILIHLDRLRRKTETEFPAARAFVRPGFDEGD